LGTEKNAQMESGRHIRKRSFFKILKDSEVGGWGGDTQFMCSAGVKKKG